MKTYTCDLCKKDFKLKGDYNRHIDKKTSCVKTEKVIEIQNKQFNDKENIDKIKKFLDFCHNTLRDKEGLVGMKALSNISMILFLKFVNNSVKEGTIDLLDIEKYRKEEGTDNNEIFKKYKDYIKYCKFENIIENGKFKVEIHDIIIIIEFIFKHILWHHPLTKKIFEDELPSIKNEITYELIFKKMDKLNFDDMDIDIKGAGYEYFLKYENASGSLGQFFTKRQVVNYIINEIKPYINENSKIIDPFMGTGGFLIKIYDELKNIYKKNNKPFTNEIKNNLINGIEKNPQTTLLALNNMLINIDLFCKNVKIGDSFRNYINDKYDICVTNPPFGIKGLIYNDTATFPIKYNNIEKKNYYPHKTNDAICLSLQMIQNILNENGICAIIIPDGKLINSSKEKSLIEVKKMLIENNNLFKITKLPSGTFLPYTGVETLILFFKKSEKTKNIKFVKLDNEYKNEKLLCNVNVEKIINTNYSLNYKLYIDLNNIKYDNLKYFEFKYIFSLEKGLLGSNNTKIDNNGQSILINWSLYGNYKKINSYKYDGENVFVSTNLPNGNEKGYFVVSYYNGKCDCCNLMSKLIINNDFINIVNIKFYYYYLKFNSSHIENNYQKGCANKTLDLELFNKMLIPLPLFEIQNLIVEELNIMEEDMKNLKICIENRKITLKAKLNILLKKTNTKENKKLNEICEFYSNSKRKSKEGKTTGKYPLYYCSILGNLYLDEYDIDEESIMVNSTNGSGKCEIYYCNGKFSFCENVIRFKSNNNLTKYIFYWCKLNKNKIEHLFVGVNQKQLSKEDLGNIIIPIPSIEEQEKIVKELDIINNDIDSMKNSIKYLEQTIKDNFDYHLDMCKKKDVKEDVNEDIQEEDDEKIIIKEKEYIKEGDNVYKIKNNKKGKLYGIYEGNKLIKQK